METVFLTDRGKVRQHNEDNCKVITNHGGQYLAIVADGMGGHKAGDVASEMTVSEFESYWVDTEKIESPQLAEEWLKEKVALINEKLFKHAEVNAECKGMGTTIVAAICTEQFITVSHIGDSRCYLLPNDDQLTQLTEDHSLVNELVRSGQITKEDAEHHPRKNVLLRALGTEDKVHVDVKSLEWDESDLLVLCSDGLTNKISDQKLEEVLLNNEQALNERADHLISQANDFGGEDNITLVLVKNTVSNSENG